MRYFFLLIATASVFSCNRKEEKQTPATVTYELKVFRLESEGGCKSDTLPCASYEVSYPVFNGLQPAVVDSLTKVIAAATDSGNPESDTLSFELAGKDFIRDYEETKEEFPEMPMGWYYHSTVEVSVLSDTLISLAVSNEYFTGGAHGGYGTYFINIDPATGRKLTLNDFLKPGFNKALNSLGEKSFRAGLELSADVSLADEGYEFGDGEFALNNNYGFTKEGIVFVFNIYEVGPYVLGSQTVSISYADLKDWLK